MQAIILAGGFGTRLKSVIGEEIPKPMAPVCGEPFLAHYLRYLKKQGVTQVVLSVYHLADVIKSHFGEEFEGMELAYAIESRPLGTGGAVKYSMELLQPKSPVLVVNGDSFVEVDVPAMMRAHIAAQAGLTIALREMPDCSRYGQVMFDDHKRITSFQYPGRPQKGWISTGCYIVSPDLFKGRRLLDTFSFESDFQHPFVRQINMLAWPECRYFIDIGVPDDYARAEEELKKRVKAA